ncbi:hypothetical protein [Mucilaginibacter sp.]
MEITFKKGLVLLAFICFTVGAKAQYSAVPDTARLSFGIDGIKTNGGFNTEYKFAVGASAQYDLPLTEKFYFTANLGYLNFGANNSAANPLHIENVSSSSMSIVPLKVGIKYYLIRTFYIQGEAGESLLLNKSSVYGIDQTGLNYDGQIGILFKRKDRKSFIDVGIRYQLMQSYYGDGNYGTMFGARIAYAFNLK